MIIYNGTYSVYCHINKINGKKYVGLTKSKPKHRWGHGTLYESCVLFNRAIQKYGWDNFEHEVIASNLTKSEAENFERLLIEKLECQNPEKGYNIRTGGDNHGDFSLGKNPKAKPVVCDGKEYSCIAEFAILHNIPKPTARAWVNGNNHMPQEWIDRGLNYKDNPIKHYPSLPNAHRGHNNCKSKPVICEGVVYESISDCAEHYGIKGGTMRGWLYKANIPKSFQDKGLSYFTENSKPKSQK